MSTNHSNNGYSNKLAGKVAVITGGTTGIGLATARRFANEGAHVFITGRRQKELGEAAALLGNNGTAIQGDVANLEDLDRLYSIVKRDAGKIDIVFANAGRGDFGRIGEITEKHFDDTFNVNVKGLLFTVQKALPLLVDGGSIILNASVVSIKGIENFGVYSASKAAVRSFARTWTSDLKDRKIRVNVISPGPIDTPIITGLVGSEEEAEKFKQGMAAGVPLGRVGEPDEIAKAAVFLGSDDSSFVAGVELFVDGGMVAV